MNDPSLASKKFFEILQNEEEKEKELPDAVECKCDSCGYTTKKVIKRNVGMSDYRYTCGICPKCGVGEMPPINAPKEPDVPSLPVAQLKKFIELSERYYQHYIDCDHKYEFAPPQGANDLREYDILREQLKTSCKKKWFR